MIAGYGATMGDGGCANRSWRTRTTAPSALLPGLLATINLPPPALMARASSGRAKTASTSRLPPCRATKMRFAWSCKSIGPLHACTQTPARALCVEHPNSCTLWHFVWKTRCVSKYVTGRVGPGRSSQYHGMRQETFWPHVAAIKVCGSGKTSTARMTTSVLLSCTVTHRSPLPLVSCAVCILWHVFRKCLLMFARVALCHVLSSVSCHFASHCSMVI